MKSWPGMRRERSSSQTNNTSRDRKNCFAETQLDVNEIEKEILSRDHNLPGTAACFFPLQQTQSSRAHEQRANKLRISLLARKRKNLAPRRPVSCDSARPRKRQRSRKSNVRPQPTFQPALTVPGISTDNTPQSKPSNTKSIHKEEVDTTFKDVPRNANYNSSPSSSRMSSLNPLGNENENAIIGSRGRHRKHSLDYPHAFSWRRTNPSTNRKNSEFKYRRYPSCGDFKRKSNKKPSSHYCVTPSPGREESSEEDDDSCQSSCGSGSRRRYRQSTTPCSRRRNYISTTPTPRKQCSPRPVCKSRSSSYTPKRKKRSRCSVQTPKYRTHRRRRSDYSREITPDRSGVSHNHRSSYRSRHHHNVNRVKFDRSPVPSRKTPVETERGYSDEEQEFDEESPPRKLRKEKSSTKIKKLTAQKNYKNDTDRGEEDEEDEEEEENKLDRKKQNIPKPTESPRREKVKPAAKKRRDGRNRSVSFDTGNSDINIASDVDKKPNSSRRKRKQRTPERTEIEGQRYFCRIM